MKNDKDENIEKPSTIFFKNMIFLEQFVESVLEYSSKYNCHRGVSYAPENLIGKPTKFPDYGDFPETYMLRYYGKWWKDSEATQPNYMPQDVDPIAAEDFIIVKFEYPVFPHIIIIYETYNPGAIVRLWGRMSGKFWKLLWEGAPVECPQTSRKFEPPIKKIPELINEIRLEFNQSLLKYHTSLDAILLAGYQPKTSLQSNIISNGLLDPVVFQKPQKNNNCCPQDPEGQQTDYFSTLPHEVLVKIFHFIDLRSLCRCSQVNRRFNGASKDASLYKEISLKRYWNKVDVNTLSYFMVRCKMLKKLDLSWCGNNGMITEDAFVEFLVQCGSSLSHLSLGNCDFLREQSFIEIGMSKNLTDLRLRNVKCNTHDFKHLCDLDKLEAIDLYNTSISDRELFRILQSNPNLRHLNVDLCEFLEELDVAAGIVATHNKKLVTWSSWKVYSLNAPSIRCLSYCNLLKELDLGWSLQLFDPDDCLESIAHGCSDLRRLILSGWRNTSDHQLLPVIRSCKQLVQLDLLGIRSITKDIIDIILVSLTKLELLDISFCGSISLEQVALWRQQYPHVTIQRSCEHGNID